MHCKHGLILYGAYCIKCKRSFESDGVVCSEGQLKVGDKIKVIGKSTSDDQVNTVKEVLEVDGREEIVINKTRNYYFITQMLITGQSWAKQVQVINDEPENRHILRR
ncbi:hypothetical protein D5018_03750 [Parashewanella curva]|uniref:Uncharacterized protein n=1 Tax=Parashewanella curva TaxID=2338552 RepID=A0A3L8PZS9_9GAMM|nr:hypothetical protein [Parashewanella curva]RLV60966.1 hypothetical protein D5018_03750 [Parashewanella curva]